MWSVLSNLIQLIIKLSCTYLFVKNVEYLYLINSCHEQDKPTTGRVPNGKQGAQLCEVTRSRGPALHPEAGSGQDICGV